MTEYKLKSSYLDFNHNVMLVNSPQFKITDLAPPIRMYRKIPDAPIEVKQPSSFVNKKAITHFIDATASADDEQYKLIREEECNPWILDDAEDKSFIGRLEGGQSSNYVLLVNQVIHSYLMLLTFFLKGK